MESVDDRWKTAPVEEPDPRGYCDGCGDPLYEGDKVYDVFGRVLCNECIEDEYGRFI